MTTTTSPETNTYATRWVHGTTTYRANDPRTFITEADGYHHLYAGTRNGKPILVGSFGTLAEAKRAA